jgi:hypothetical protein
MAKVNKDTSDLDETKWLPVIMIKMSKKEHNKLFITL